MPKAEIDNDPFATHPLVRKIVGNALMETFLHGDPDTAKTKSFKPGVLDKINALNLPSDKWKILVNILPMGAGHKDLVEAKRKLGI